MLNNLVFVGIGGFFGAGARYLLSMWTDALLVSRLGAFPYGTLIVNVIGSFGFALFGVWFSARAGIPAHVRLLAGTGFFGAFTTFSTYANDSLSLFGDGALGLPLLNVILNNGLCLLAAAAGLFLGHRLFVAV
ncbi:MAG: fluoride efflux transporter CrcB [Chloroflexi bacterium]|nr:fluoride efflux transporter CrcB [Chloroflexota bacterium]